MCSLYIHARFVSQSGLSSDSYSLRTRNVVTRLREDRINMELLMVCYISCYERLNIKGLMILLITSLLDLTLCQH